MMRLPARFMAFLGAIALAFAGTSPARADTVTCHGKFINPITDVCWSCLFPLSIGGTPVRMHSYRGRDSDGSSHSTRYSAARSAST